MNSQVPRHRRSQVATAGAPPWSQIAPTLHAGLDPNSTNPCNRGDPPCVQSVLAEMRKRYER